MFAPRMAGKGTVVEFADELGSIVTLKADKQGWITPESDRDAAVLDSFGFAVDSDEAAAASDAGSDED